MNYWHGLEKNIHLHMGIEDVAPPEEVLEALKQANSEIKSAAKEKGIKAARYLIHYGNILDAYRDALYDNAPDPSDLLSAVKSAVDDWLSERLSLNTFDTRKQVSILSDEMSHEVLFGLIGGDLGFNEASLTYDGLGLDVSDWERFIDRAYAAASLDWRVIEKDIKFAFKEAVSAAMYNIEVELEEKLDDISDEAM